MAARKRFAIGIKDLRLVFPNSRDCSKRNVNVH
jgi:hypothetical protein